MVSSHASKKPQHQLGFRRHQVMDITDDANTNSMNRLTIQNEEVIATSSRENLDKDHHSQPPPAYNLFYHGGDGINRFNSKKLLNNLKKQQSRKELNGGSFMTKT